MRRTILIIFVFTSTISLTKSSLLCNVEWPSCSLTVQNIVCTRDQKCVPHKGCQDLPMDPEFSKYILHEHNRLRQKIASGQETRGYTGVAANMNALSYDKNLEYTAKCNVNRCNGEHDSCHGTLKFPTSGQNIYFSAESEDGLKNAVNVWFNEIDKMTSNIIDKYPKGHTDVSQFTQVIWAKTTHIGCARAKSTTEQKYYLVCNYGPAGNWAGYSVYDRGTPCSKCGFFVKCNKLYPALCGDIDQSYLGDGRGGSGDSVRVNMIPTTPKSNRGLFSGLGDATGLGRRGSMNLGFGNSGSGNSAGSSTNLNLGLGNGGSMKLGFGNSGGGLSTGLGNGGSMKLGFGNRGGKSSAELSTGLNVGLGNGGSMKLGFGNSGGSKSEKLSTGLDVGLGNGGSMKLGFGHSGGKSSAELSTGLNLGLGNGGSMKLGFGNTGGKENAKLSTGLSTGLNLSGKESGEIGASIGAGGLNVNVGLGRGHNKHKNGKDGSGEAAEASIGLGGLGKLGLGRNNNRGRGRGHNKHNTSNSGDNSDESGAVESVITSHKLGGLGAIAPKSAKITELLVPTTPTITTASSTTYKPSPTVPDEITPELVTDTADPIRNLGTFDTELVDIITDSETTYKTTQGRTTQESTITKSVGMFIPEISPIFELKSVTIPPQPKVTDKSESLISEPEIIFGSETSPKPILTNTSISESIIPPLKPFKIPDILAEAKDKVLFKEITFQPILPIIPEIVTTPELEPITIQSIHELTADPLLETVEPITPEPKPYTTFTPLHKPIIFPILDSLSKPKLEIPLDKMTPAPKPPKLLFTVSKPKFEIPFEKITLPPKPPKHLVTLSKPKFEIPRGKITLPPKPHKLLVTLSPKFEIPLEKLTLPPNPPKILVTLSKPKLEPLIEKITLPPIIPKIVPQPDVKEITNLSISEHIVPLEKITVPPIIPKIVLSPDLKVITNQSILEDIVNPIQGVEQIIPEMKYDTITKQIIPTNIQGGINSTNGFPNLIITYNETKEEIDSETPFALGFLKWHEVKWYAIGAAGVIAIVIISFVLGRVCRPNGSYWIKRELPQPIHGKISKINQPTSYSNEGNDNPRLPQPIHGEMSHTNQQTLYCNEDQPTSHYNEAQPTSHYNEAQPTLHFNEVDYNPRLPQPIHGKTSHTNQQTLYYNEDQPTLHYNEDQPTLHYNEDQPTLQYKKGDDNPQTVFL